MFFSKVSFDDYKHFMRAFEKASDNEVLKIIEHFKPTYFPDEVSFDKLMNDLKEMFLADERYNSIERAAYLGLRRLMNSF